MALITTKTLLPGKPGTKKECSIYGDDLVCIRYKNDIERNLKIKTVELIVEQKVWNKKSDKIPPNKKVYIKIGFDEIQLRRLVHHAGGIWISKKKLWKMNYGEVVNLNLEDRIC